MRWSSRCCFSQNFVVMPWRREVVEASSRRRAGAGLVFRDESARGCAVVMQSPDKKLLRKPVFRI